MLRELQKSKSVEIEQAQTALADIRKDIERARDLRVLLAEDEGKLAEAHSRAEANKQALTELSALTAARQAEADTLQRNLEFDNIDSAKAHLAQTTEALQAMEKALQDAQDAYEKLTRELGTTDAVLGERHAAQREAESRLARAQAHLESVLAENGFADLPQYEQAVLPEDDRSALQQEIERYEGRLRTLESDVRNLAERTAGKQHADLTDMQAGIDDTAQKLEETLETARTVQSALDANLRAYQNLSASIDTIANNESQFADYQVLSATANGELTGKPKVTLEAYAQAAFFEMILQAANVRFAKMTGNRFQLIRKTTPANLTSYRGLEIDILDQYTGKQRDVRTLSGGESFQASLSLAMGLSDIVSATTGGVMLDAMFIDEGFGSLDEDALSAAIETLRKMSGNRITGIISHVGNLGTLIEKQIVVHGGATGSSIEIID